MKNKVVIFIFAFFIYAGTFNHSYVLDDNDVIRNNELTHKGVKAISTIFKTSYRAISSEVIDNLYRPLSRALFALEWDIWPGKPGGAHVINVILYAIACVLVYQLLLGYFKETKIPLTAALLFAALPIHVEAVANLKSADELLALIFSLYTLLLIHKYFNTQKASTIVIAVLSFFISLFAKESSVTLIAIIPLSIYFFSPATPKKNLQVSSFFLIPLVTYLLIRHSVLSQFNEQLLDNKSNYLVSIGNFVSQKSSAIMLLGYYLLIILLPYRLMSDGSFNEFPAVNFYDLRCLIPMAIFLAALIFSLFRIKRKEPETFFILFFLIAVAPVSNIFFLIGTNYGERLMLTPSLGICALLSIFIYRFFSDKIKSKNQKPGRKPIYISIVVLLIYTPLTMLRAADWKDEFTLFSKDAVTASNSARAQYYYGNQFVIRLATNGNSPELQGEVTNAIDALHRAVEIQPDYHEAYYSLGEIYERIGNLDSAANNYKKAAEIFPGRAYYLLNYGNVIGMKGDLESARKYFKLAIKTDSTYRDAWLNLGITYLQQGKEFQADSLTPQQKNDQAELKKANGLLMAYTDSALVFVNKSVAINPNVAYGYQVLGTIYTIRNETDKANEYFQKAGSLQ